MLSERLCAPSTSLSHSIAVNADRWPDDLRLSDIEPVCVPGLRQARRRCEARLQLEQAAERRDGLSVSPFSTGVPNRQHENCAAVVGSRPPDGNRHPNPAPLRRAAALPSYPAWWGRLPSGSGAMLAKSGVPPRRRRDRPAATENLTVAAIGRLARGRTRLPES